MPRVSIIIPVKGRRAFLKEAVAACHAQTFQDFELLIIPDEEGNGPARARNEGAREASGTYLAFLDSDDLWLAEKLEVQVNHMEERGAVISQTEERWLRNGTPLEPLLKHQKQGGWIYERCLPLCVVSPSAVMMRRKEFLDLGGFDPDYFVCEDYEFWLRVALRYPIELIKKPLVIKRGGHADQLSRSFAGFDALRIRALVKTLEHETLSEGQREKTLEALALKCKIYASGAKKRERLEDAAFYEALPQRAREGCYPLKTQWPNIPEYENFLAVQNLH